MNKGMEKIRRKKGRLTLVEAMMGGVSGESSVKKKES